MTRTLLRRARRFKSSEDGSMVFFVLVCMILMLFAGGMAIDMMRYESDRAKIQAVADSAALAAASMRRTTDAKDIVEDWFQKAGVPEALVNVHADTRGLNYRDVYVETRTTTRPYFMQMMGIDKLTSAGEGRAIESRSNVEISMVLDVSGSMNNSNRATNLKVAAKEFIAELLAGDVDGRTSFNVVPYNGQVNLGQQLFARHTKSYAHDLPSATAPRFCLDFPLSAYDSVPISRTTPFAQTSYADSYYQGWSSGTTPPDSYNSDYQAPNTAGMWCVGSANNAIRLGSGTESTLRSMIDNLVFTGATSIDLGFKWGASLLDPSSRGLFGDLAESKYAARPLAYDDPYALKVIVLMTDGEHWEQEMMNDGYRGKSMSPIYRVVEGKSTIRWAIHLPEKGGANTYYTPHDGKWASSPNGGTGTATQQTWEQVWYSLKVQWVAAQLYARPLSSNATTRLAKFNSQMKLFRTYVTKPDMDARLLKLCRQTREKNVVIFGIAFEAPAAGAKVISDCASPGRFYDVAGLDIRSAFRSIRMQIQALRLTQ